MLHVGRPFLPWDPGFWHNPGLHESHALPSVPGKDSSANCHHYHHHTCDCPSLRCSIQMPTVAAKISIEQYHLMFLPLRKQGIRCTISFNTKDSFLRSSMISAKCLSYHFVHINLKADWNAIQNKPFYWQEGKRLLACSTYYHTNSYNDCLSPRSEQIRLCFCFTIPKFPRQTARLEGLGF